MKKCKKCNKDKLTSEFNKKTATKDGLQHICKDCDRIRAKTLYANNREHYKAMIIKNKTDNLKIIRAFICDYLREHGCVDCNQRDIRCLEFDHIRGIKRKNLSIMIAQNYSLNSIKLEIEKCEVRCANCHRIRTADVQGWFKSK